MTELPPSDAPDLINPGVTALAGGVLVEVSISDDRWLSRLPGLAALAGETARDAFLAGCGSMNPGDGGSGGVEISLTFTDDAFIQELNARHRNMDKPTNVLSFPAVSPESIKEAIGQLQGNGKAAEPELLLGDVVLAVETIMEEAKDQQKRPADHVAHLVAHGVLHLLGFDHDQSAAAARMEGLEIRVLENLGIGNPYETAVNASAGSIPASAASGQDKAL